MTWHDILVNLGSNVLGPVALGFFAYLVAQWKNSKKINRPRKPVLVSAAKNEEIQDLLIEIRLRLQADRAYFCLFHNGEFYTQGSEIMKYSRTNESVSPGISLEAQHYQNVLISLVTDEMKLLSDENPSFTKISELKDGKFKRMSNARNVKCICRCAVRKGQEMIGFVGLDYNNLIEKPANIDELVIYAGRIEQIISSYD